LLAAARSEANIVPLREAHVAATEIPTQSPRRLRRTLAASILLTALGVLAWYGYDTHIRNVYTTGIGEQHRITLADGSIVELNAQSKIRVRYKDRRRDVELLDGQALFQVAHDTTRPFIVHTDSTNIRAVGTQFDVYRKSTGTVVTVLEGTVAVG